MTYDHRCWIRGENDCDMKCDSDPVSSKPCGYMCESCQCASCNQAGGKQAFKDFGGERR